MTKEETRINAALKALGQQGGTVHDIAREFGISVDELLYGRVNIPIQGAFGYHAAQKIKLDRYSTVRTEAIDVEGNKGKVAFWIGFLDTLWLRMFDAIAQGETLESLLRKPMVIAEKEYVRMVCSNTVKL